MVRYFYGQDSYAARQTIDELATSLKATIVFVDRSDIEQESLAARLDKGGSGLFGRQLLIVRDPSAFPASLQAGLVAVAESKGSLEIVLWDRVKPDTKSVFWKTYKKHGQEFATLPSHELRQWLVETAAAFGATLDVSAGEELVRRVGQDRFRLMSELEVLTLRFKKVGREEVIQAIADSKVPEMIFALTDALLAKNRERALLVLDGLIASGESEIGLLGFIASQVRTLLLVQAGVQAGLSANEIAQRYGLKPYPVQKNTPIARRYSRGELLDMYTRILATDFAMKGRVEARTALIMLVMGMTQNQASRALPAGR